MESADVGRREASLGADRDCHERSEGKPNPGSPPGVPARKR